MAKNKMRPDVPGEILREEYRVPMGVSVRAQSWLNLPPSDDPKIAEVELQDRIEREVEEMAA